jgi:hypothetical protein
MTFESEMLNFYIITTILWKCNNEIYEMEKKLNTSQEVLIKPINCKGLKDVPNAWGHQKYSGQYLRISVDNQKDVNNKLERYGTLRDFVIRHIEGIKMKGKSSVDFCKNCTCQD